MMRVGPRGDAPGEAMRIMLRAAVKRACAVRAFAPLLLVAAGLAGCASQPTGLGDGPRSVVLNHPSGETVAVTYWRPGGGYDADALREISMLFRDRRSGEVIPVDPALIDMLVELRQRAGAPPEAPIRLTSGYRSPASNALLARTNANVADNSYHMRGQAADFSIPGVSPTRLAEEAAAMRRGGYAMYPSTGHVHVDTGPFRTWTPKGGGGEPRVAPVLQEARAPEHAPPKAPERIVLADASPVPHRPLPTGPIVLPPDILVPNPPPARAAPIKATAGTKPALGKGAVAKPPVSPDLVRVRAVLAQLKEQPKPAAVKKKPQS
jgi:uncharacterized protein YcbK (DUF882 family)